MMFLFLKSKKFLLLIFVCLLTACNIHQDPVYKPNKIFLEQYEKKISRARDKHKKIAKRYNITYNKDDEKLANLVDRNLLRYQNNVKFLENYKDVLVDVEKEEVSYATENHGPYIKEKISNYTYYDKFLYLKPETFKEKDFMNIDSDTLQVNYDYVVLIKELKDKKIEILNIEEKKRLEIEKANAPKTTIVDKIQSIGTSITDKFKNLFKSKQ